ncbi:hypothetical protein MTR_3g011760 [Medicago truncatula]|uniref:Uncharacterized protein n=1 Tax=Medicago truncatula TaxID=3880 RepID=A0A072UTI6_MEDTR|nr:hypothetical protein MTR_3g011760 [Medicago truncatula]
MIGSQRREREEDLTTVVERTKVRMTVVMRGWWRERTKEVEVEGCCWWPVVRTMVVVRTTVKEDGGGGRRMVVEQRETSAESEKESIRRE